MRFHRELMLNLYCVLCMAKLDDMINDYVQIHTPITWILQSYLCKIYFSDVINDDKSR